MVSVFDFEDYREFLKAWIHFKKEKGLKSTLSKKMNVSSTMLSLILKGEKSMSLEHASDLADYLGFTDSEIEYFFLIVELGKAGSHNLKQKLLKRCKQLKKDASKISKRINKDVELSEETKSIFYASWMQTGIRILTAIPEMNSINHIAKHLGLPVSVVSEVVNFLLSHGLCRQIGGKLTYGPMRTHVDFESAHVNKHHQNWRVKGIQNMELKKNSDLFFTGPLALSKEMAIEIRNLLPTYIDEVMKKVGPSESEVAYCFNIDWFEF